MSSTCFSSLAQIGVFNYFSKLTVNPVLTLIHQEPIKFVKQGRYFDLGGTLARFCFFCSLNSKIEEKRDRVVYAARGSWFWLLPRKWLYKIRKNCYGRFIRYPQLMDQISCQFKRNKMVNQMHLPFYFDPFWKVLRLLRKKKGLIGIHSLQSMTAELIDSYLLL